MSHSADWQDSRLRDAFYLIVSVLFDHLEGTDAYSVLEQARDAIEHADEELEVYAPAPSEPDTPEDRQRDMDESEIIK